MVQRADTLYSDLLHKVYVGSGKWSWTEAELQLQNSKTCYFKNIMVDPFAKHSRFGLFYFGVPSSRPYR